MCVRSRQLLFDNANRVPRYNNILVPGTDQGNTSSKRLGCGTRVPCHGALLQPNLYLTSYRLDQPFDTPLGTHRDLRAIPLVSYGKYPRSDTYHRSNYRVFVFRLFLPTRVEEGNLGERKKREIRRREIERVSQR